MLLGQWSISVTTVGRFSLHKRKLSELWLVHSPELHVEVSLNRNFSSHMPVSIFINGLGCQ
jgi:hypothetical protein